MRSVRGQKRSAQVKIQTEANDLELLSEGCVERREGFPVLPWDLYHSATGASGGAKSFFPRPLRTLQNEVSNLLKSFPNS